MSTRFLASNQDNFREASLPAKEGIPKVGSYILPRTMTYIVNFGENIYSPYIRTHSDSNNMYMAFNIGNPHIRFIVTWVFNTISQPTLIERLPMMPLSSMTERREVYHNRVRERPDRESLRL